MIPQIPQETWEETLRGYRALRSELEVEHSQKLQGMVEAYTRMQPFTTIKSLWDSRDADRLRLAKLILIKRELEGLSREELQGASPSVHPLKDFFQSMAAFFGYNAAYSRREIAFDLLGERKGKPYSC